jgi:hypothetical protein
VDDDVGVIGDGGGGITSTTLQLLDPQRYVLTAARHFFGPPADAIGTGTELIWPLAAARAAAAAAAAGSPLTTTGAGGDNGIDHNKSPLRFPYVSDFCDPVISTRTTAVRRDSPWVPHPEHNERLGSNDKYDDDDDDAPPVLRASEQACSATGTTGTTGTAVPSGCAFHATSALTQAAGAQFSAAALSRAVARAP